jgi:acyl-CoA synthetase (AMP-forming)/AMP-acid ligase II
VGKPRLVLYSRANIDSSLDAILSVFDRDRIDAIFSYPQPFHTFGLILGYLQSLVTGKPLIAPPGRYTSDFQSAWQTAARAHPGLLTLGTPTHFQDLVKAVTDANLTPSATYSAIIGGAATPRALWIALRDRAKISAPSIGYGCTEASPGLTHLPPGVEPEVDGEIGAILPKTDLVLVPGVGIEFSGPQLCLATIQDGKIHFPTRVLILDRLRERAPGHFLFEGRYDLVFNRGGVKFSLEEIESHLKTVFPSSDFLCVATKDERLGEDLGVLWSTEGVTPETSAMIEALAARFHVRFDSRRILSVAKLPTNAAAKPDRGMASELFT